MSLSYVAKCTPILGWNANEYSPTENQFLKFISYFRGPILYVMEIAVVLAAGLQDWIDFGVIIAIVRVKISISFPGISVLPYPDGLALTETVVDERYRGMVPRKVSQS